MVLISDFDIRAFFTFRYFVLPTRDFRRFVSESYIKTEILSPGTTTLNARNLNSVAESSKQIYFYSFWQTEQYGCGALTATLKQTKCQPLFDSKLLNHVDTRDPTNQPCHLLQKYVITLTELSERKIAHWTDCGSLQLNRSFAKQHESTKLTFEKTNQKAC
jgi:hypothetical protein